MSKGNLVDRDMAIEVANRFMENFKGIYAKYDIAGSIRRRSQTVRDIDLVVELAELSNLFKFNGKLAKFFGNTRSGATKMTGIIDNIPVQVTTSNPDGYGAALLKTTGSATFNIGMRRIAISKGWSLNEYGLWGQGHKLVCDCSEERPIFDALGLDYRDPFNREV